MKKSLKTKKNLMQFYLLSASITPLNAKNWNNNDLKARFWRLYHHDGTGASMKFGTQLYPIMPDYVYLIPPNVHFGTHAEKAVSQLNIHFLIRKRPVRYMSAAFRTKADRKLKNYFEMGFQNGGSRESI